VLKDAKAHDLPQPRKAALRRRLRTAGGHDRSSGPRSGAGTRPRLNKP